MTNNDILMTVDQAAEFLAVIPQTVRDYINAGKLKAHKLGNGTGKRSRRREWRIWKSDLVDFVNRSDNTKEEAGSEE